ncbi:Uncharacterised protein [Mycobacterium tuberculosis]|uniref:Uncharacterized protein n=1 Tax=Mycobacterium tuberculosis TaxID=1773 RepID=A0A654TKJ1_MYCTX|nr:Uncharacterised protein [Mycobacterium tuberculosis]SGO87724.1 Uncharacterised protein [Mycobacterium tuberculosis]
MCRPSTRKSSTGSPRVFCATRSARCGEGSTAVTRAAHCKPSPANSAVLPPGPAHRSSHRPVSPSTGARVNARATNWLPSSWTSAWPSRTGASRPGSPRGRYTANGEYRPTVPRTARASSPAVSTPGRAARCTAGRSSSLAKTASSSPTAAPNASAKAWAIHRGCACTNAACPIGSFCASGASSPTQDRSSRPAIVRSTPLTKPARAESNSIPACSTVVDTAACASTRVRSNW